MTTDVRTVASLTRLLNSASGNPRFRVVFTDGTAANTKPDAAVNYDIQNPEYRGPCEVQLDAGEIARMVPVACLHRERGDDDLHHPDGTHRTTPATTDGRVLSRHEERLRRHLAHVRAAS